MNQEHPSLPRRMLAAWLAPALAAAAVPGSALGAAGHEAEPPAGAYCSATAADMFKACGHEATDELFVGRAKCINVGDARARKDCQDEVKAAFDDKTASCQAQLDARHAACAVLGEARYDPDLDPSRFDDDFHALSNPNPYFPLGIGYKWELTGKTEFNTIEVLDQTKLIEGLRCIVFRDLVYGEDGKLKEATDDWFAAARDGSTWYCGEQSKAYETFAGDRPKKPELVSIDGTFKHGRDGDKAGTIMPARPTPGQLYREEFSLGNAEDLAEILSATYAYGSNAELDHFVPKALAERLCQGDCVVTRNTSLTDPASVEIKYYARGIGFFLETDLDGVALQLTRCNFDARCASLPAP